MKRLIIIILVIILLTGCLSKLPEMPTQDIKAIGTQIAATMIAGAVQTQQAMATPTKEPTNTPIPTPTKAPEPILLSGNGSDVVDVEISYDLAIAHVKGNQQSRYFSIKSYDKNGAYIDLLVNTTDSYDGIVPVNFNGEKITRFAIAASGKWSMDILPLSSARTFSIPGKIDGTGTDVVIITGGIPDMAKITGNKQSRYFGVKGFNINGEYIDLLVNTTDPYEGKVILNGEISVLVIASEGTWTIDVTIRK